MYSLCALLGRSEVIEASTRSFEGSRRVVLAAGMSIVPLSEDALAAIARSGVAPGGASVAGAFEFLSAGVEALGQSLSRGGAIAYVETEYMGGEGFERVAMWSHGKIALGPLDGAGSINQALRALGVEAPAGTEEFEFVGLNRHRSIEEWL